MGRLGTNSRREREVLYYDSEVDVLLSAFRHGADVEQVEHALVVDEIAEDPTRYLVLGPDPTRPAP
jgi:hypothetical protein